MAPQASSATNGSWYGTGVDGGAKGVASRALAHYEYDYAGRMLEISHRWHVLDSSDAITSNSALLGNTCAYEQGTSGLRRGLKTSSTYYNQSSNPSNFQALYTSNFSYDGQRDFLTQAVYNDGYPSNTFNWQYDAAGNRTSQSCVFDALNRQVECNTYSYESDAVGNRISREHDTTHVVNTYTWDAVNRLTNYNSQWSYSYRADGMRTKKAKNSSNYTYFRYDGQMPMQDEGKDAGTYSITNYALGARGIDMQEYLNSSLSVTATLFPIYDAHGNSVATIARSGTNSYTLGNYRTYGAWGELRYSGSTAPNRYCANLGHKADDETGLIYMRARYYDVNRGRFISQDPAKDGPNWYGYCCSDPVNLVDESGRASDFSNWARQIAAIVSGTLGFLIFLSIAVLATTGAMTVTEAAFAAKIAILAYGFAQNCSNGNWSVSAGLGLAEFFVFSKLIDTIVAGMEASKNVSRLVCAAVAYVGAYSLVLVAEMWIDFSSNGVPGAN